MGTIVFYQATRAGTPAQPDTDILKLDDSFTRTADSTTSTTPESLLLSDTTTLLGIQATSGAHRVATSSANTGNGLNYLPIAEDTTADPLKIMWVGVAPGDTIYYRSEA